MKPGCPATTSSLVTGPVRPRLTRGERRPQRPQQQQHPWDHRPAASLKCVLSVSRRDSQCRGSDEVPKNVHLLLGVAAPAHRPAPGIWSRPSNCQCPQMTDNISVV